LPYLYDILAFFFLRRALLRRRLLCRRLAFSLCFLHAHGSPSTKIWVEQAFRPAHRRAILINGLEPMRYLFKSPAPKNTKGALCSAPSIEYFFFSLLYIFRIAFC